MRVNCHLVFHYSYASELQQCVFLGNNCFSNQLDVEELISVFVCLLHAHYKFGS